MINIIVAYTKLNRVIGYKNKIPWKIQDMAHFVSLTERHPVIMGRKTWDSIPSGFRPLKNRLNIVISHNVIRGIDCFHDLGHAVDFARNFDEEIYIIGGESIYREALWLDCVDKVIASEIHKDYYGDRFFPELDNYEWSATLVVEHEEFNIVEYVRVRA